MTIDTMTIDTITAIQSLVPNAECIVRGDEIEWHSPGLTQPTQAEIDAEITRLQAVHTAQEYARNRAAEYPSQNDYLDGIVKNDQSQIDKYIADCQAVKDKYPKS
jgi:hypothetical protein